jgi:hypothetical protein
VPTQSCTCGPGALGARMSGSRMGMSTLPGLARALRRTSCFFFFFFFFFGGGGGGRFGYKDHMCEQQMDGWWDGGPTSSHTELIHKSMLLFLPCRQKWFEMC